MKHTALLAIVALLASHRAALAQVPNFQMIVIDPVGGSSFDASGCSDVSDLGLVVGRNAVNGTLVPFEWTAPGGFRTPTHLPPFLGERRVNNRGDSVWPGTPFVILASGALTPLPDPIGNPSNGGTDLNDALRVIGQGVHIGTSSTVHTWTPQSGSTSVDITAASALTRVNAHGVAVGYRLFNGTNRRAFVVDLPTQAWVDLHSALGGTGNSEAVDVNEHGQVLGVSSHSGAFVWSPGGGFSFLPGFVPSEVLYVAPRAIDNRGRVVGRARTASGDYHAFLWSPSTGMVDLDALQNSTFTLVEALDISESGVVIGRGFYGQVWGPDRGFILHEPLGAPYCSATTNSAGCAASISASGSPSLAANRLTLTATCVTGGSFLFFHGPTQVTAPFGNGVLCVGSLTRIAPVGAPIGSVAQAQIDLPAAGLTTPGPRHFQCWFRDPLAGGSNSNTSNALTITFTP